MIKIFCIVICLITMTISYAENISQPKVENSIIKRDTYPPKIEDPKPKIETTPNTDKPNKVSTIPKPR